MTSGFTNCSCKLYNRAIAAAAPPCSSCQNMIQKGFLPLITKLIEIVYAFLWGDLFTLPVMGSSVGISLMLLLLIPGRNLLYHPHPAASASPVLRHDESPEGEKRDTGQPFLAPDAHHLHPPPGRYGKPGRRSCRCLRVVPVPYSGCG